MSTLTDFTRLIHEVRPLITEAQPVLTWLLDQFHPTADPEPVEPPAPVIVPPAPATPAPTPAPAKPAWVNLPYTFDAIIPLEFPPAPVDPPKATPRLSNEDAQRRALAALTKTPAHINDVYQTSQVPMGQLLGVLLHLEMSGKVKQHSGQRFALAN